MNEKNTLQTTFIKISINKKYFHLTSFNSEIRSPKSDQCYSSELITLKKNCFQSTFIKIKATKFPKSEFSSVSNQ